MAAKLVLIAMSDDDVLVDVADGVGTVTVNRPEKRNAMDIPTRKKLREAFEKVANNDNVRVIVLRGAGDNSFIAGGDLEMTAEFDHVDGLEYITEHAQGLYNYVAEVSKPTIAAVDGYALGGGAEIAIACDIRVATNNAKIGFPEVGLGLIPAGGGTQRLAAIVGAGKAKELLFRGNIITSRTASEIGLFNHVYPQDEFDDRVAEITANISENAPLALRLAKETVNQSISVDDGLNFERVAGAYLFGTEDQTEGAQAFLENRDPEFTGR